MTDAKNEQLFPLMFIQLLEFRHLHATTGRPSITPPPQGCLTLADGFQAEEEVENSNEHQREDLCSKTRQKEASHQRVRKVIFNLKTIPFESAT